MVIISLCREEKNVKVALIPCRTIASASEAAKAGIPLDNYQENSHVCTNFEHLNRFPFD